MVGPFGDQAPFSSITSGAAPRMVQWKLFHNDGHHDDEGGKVLAGRSTWEAIRIIIVADAVMALDNVIALVGAPGVTSFC